MILAGDVGGTKVNLALCEVFSEYDGLRVVAYSQRRYCSSQFPDLEHVLARYFLDVEAEISASIQNIKVACFGVPGTVLEGRCQTVNLPWVIEEAKIAKELRIPRVHLINDLKAMAYGSRALREGNGLVVLRAGEKVRGHQALIAPGTGLGEAMMIWDGQKQVVVSSEGGHCDFGPQDEEQIELLRWLWLRHSHVSVEHVASGPAIYRLYRFLKETGREKEPEDLAMLFSDPSTDPSPIIASRQDPICVHAMELWLSCLGAAAGNLMLKTLCFGGLFLGGGVVPNILEFFQRPVFFRFVHSKGRLSEVIKKVPVYAVVDQHTARNGAALYGALLPMP